MLEIQTIVCGAYQENAYLVNGELLIDPGDNIEKLVAAVKAPRAILLTHGHFDHMLAAEPLQEKFGIDVYIHPSDAQSLSDVAHSMYDPAVASLPAPSAVRHLAYGDRFEGFQVLHTPGHSPGSICLYDAAAGVLFSGDTLFRAGFGRTDLAGGSMMQLRASLRTLFALPPETRVYPGHGDSTTIGEERARYGW
jgi:hydroxyacylglutathione hydrolase